MAEVTVCDVSGTWWDWVGMQHASNLPGPGQPWTLNPSTMWTFRDPQVAGCGNAREANNVRGIEIGTVVQMTFFNYTPAPSGMTRPNVNGTFIDGIGADPTAPVPQYVFNYPLPPLPTSLPIHDHRDNFNGGFAFSVYHPGTSLPQNSFAL
jgi:hypothetical protein